MRKSTFFVLLALTASGIGIGAGIAAALISMKTRSSEPYVPLSLDASANASLCTFDALNPVTDSLNNVRAINAIASDPLPALFNFGNNFTPDLIASFTPTPWPNISDRAREARVPIVMYHDITPVKAVDWDVTPEEFAQHIQAIQDAGLTPISMDQLVNHLRTGASLPEKPILLTFDDNYLGQYSYAFPLLKQYGYPAVWSVHTHFVGSTAGKPKATWDQLREMQSSGLITVASHTVNHQNLSTLDDEKVQQELQASKQILEKELGVPIRYFTYPEGSYSDRVKNKVAEAGYEAALTMSLDANEERVANKSDDLLAIMRYGQSRLKDAIPEAWGGPQSQSTFALVPAPTSSAAINFTAPVQKREVTIDRLPLTLVYGGKPVTVHADTRMHVQEIMLQTNAIAAVDGGFFSLESLQGNKMIGPVLSQNSSNAGVFNPGNRGENPLLRGRPLVLISGNDIKFVPYDPDKYASLEQLQAEMPGVTDAFVAAGWLVRNGKPQPAESFGKLYGFDATRDRAFWGIDSTGRPVIGVTMEMIDSVGLGIILAKAGLRDVVMLDSGASAALAYKGKSVMSYEPRPVPHIVALLPPDPMQVDREGQKTTVSCPVSANPSASDTSSRN